MNLVFLNSAFLLAVSAAVLPLVIHLISRRRVEIVEFSSIRFLKELERKKIRRVKLRQIALLIVRTLIILAIALAAARPTLSGPLAAGAGRARTSVAIVLDASASMARAGEGGGLFERARAAAHEVVGLLAEGDQAFLVTAGTPPGHVIEGGTFSRTALAAAIDRLQPGHEATDYSGALGLALEALLESRNLNREIYLIGDQQATGWDVAAPPGDAPTESATGDAGAPGARLREEVAARAYVIEVGGPVGNAGVRSVTAARRYGGSPGLYSVTAEAANHGRSSREMQLRLFVDGVQAGQAGVELAAGAQGNARFAVAVDEGAWHEGWVEIPPDALAADNRRYFVIAPSRTTEVLVVEPDDDAPRGDAYYLSRALDPTGKGGAFHVVRVPASRLADQERGRFPVVVLADAGRLNAESETWLSRHLAAGGGLLVVFGGRTDVRAWNAGSTPGAAGVKIRELAERREGARLAPSAYGHGLLDGLVFGERLVDEISVRRMFTAAVDGAEEILEVPGLGPVLLVVASADAGEVALLLTSVEPDWCDLPRSGFLVPLSHRLTERLAGVGAAAGDALVGEELSVPVAAERSGPVMVAVPGAASPVPAVPGRGRAVLPAGETRAPGTYVFSRAGTVEALAAVNVAAAESDLTPASEAEIAERLVGLSPVFATAEGELERQVMVARHGRELWRVFVYIAVGLLALEVYLARPRVV